MSVEEMHRRFKDMMGGEKTGGEKKSSCSDPVPRITSTTYLVAQDADGLINFMTKAFGADNKFRSGQGEAACMRK